MLEGENRECDRKHVGLIWRRRGSLIHVMLRGRVILALVLVGTWIATMLHVGLEANGLIPDHEHRVSHEHTSTGEHTSHEESDTVGDHDPIIARSVLKDGRLSFWLLVASAPLVCILVWLGLNLPIRVVKVRKPPRPRGILNLSSWQFMWRCASFTTAPPLVG